MTAIHSPDIPLNGAGTRREVTDGYHLVVNALKLNDVRTIYGLVGIPITDLARIAQASGIRTSAFVTKATRFTRERQPAFSRRGRESV